MAEKILLRVRADLDQGARRHERVNLTPACAILSETVNKGLFGRKGERVKRKRIREGSNIN